MICVNSPCNTNNNWVCKLKWMFTPDCKWGDCIKRSCHNWTVHSDAIEHNMKEKAFKPPHDKTNKMTVRPAKTQISLGIRPVWSKSLLCTHWVAKEPNFLRVDSEDSDQTGRMPRLIWVFAGYKCHFVGFVRRRLIFRAGNCKYFPWPELTVGVSQLYYLQGRVNVAIKKQHFTVLCMLLSLPVMNALFDDECCE